MTSKGCVKALMLAMGFGLAFISLPLVILLLHAIVTGGHILGLVIPTVMLVIPAILLLFFGFRASTEEEVHIGKSMERRVLQMASANGVELTAAKLALGSQLRVDQCKNVLEQFEAMGLARSHVGAQGEMRYVFPELQQSLESEEDDFLRRLYEAESEAVLDFEVEEPEEITRDARIDQKSRD